MLFIAYCESANYAGYGQHFVVKANIKNEVEELLEFEANEYFWEQDADQLEEDGIEDAPYYSIISVEEFGPEHKYWGFYQDPSQAEFYTKVNF